MLPDALLAIRVYVVVDEGDIDIVPFKPMFPIPWFMLTVVAPEIFQLSVEEAPWVILGGLAVKEPMIGAEPPCVGILGVGVVSAGVVGGESGDWGTTTVMQPPISTLSIASKTPSITNQVCFFISASSCVS